MTLLKGHVLASLALAAAAPAGCAAPECADPDYRDPECRLLAENALATLRTADGLEVRFVDPAAPDAEPWTAAGLVELAAPGEVVARVAAPGEFALRVAGAGPLALTLDNVDPDAEVVARLAGQELPIAAAAGLRRRLAVELAPGTTLEIRGTRRCPDRFRVAVTGDVQGNTLQLARILQRLSAEHDEAAAAGEALVALVLLGDVSAHGEPAELLELRALLAASPVPVAVGVGNHDVVDAEAPRFNRVFGPGNYAYSVCSLRGAQIDSGTGVLAPSLEARLPALLDRGAARFHVVGTHIPPYPGRTGGGWASERQAELLLVEAAIQRSDAVLAGHVHTVMSFPRIPVGDGHLREYIVGTGGGGQGAGVPRFGYLRLQFAETLTACFVEVPPTGADGPLQGAPAGVPLCPD